MTVAIHLHIQRFGRDQPVSQDQQSGGKAKDKQNDHTTGEGNLGHGDTAICAKEAKPSDISPVRTNAMPKPRNPFGRSA